MHFFSLMKFIEILCSFTFKIIYVQLVICICIALMYLVVHVDRRISPEFEYAAISKRD